MADDPSPALGANGGGFKVIALGEEWTLLPPTQADKAEYVAWIKACVRQEAFEAREGTKPEDFRALLSAVNEEIASGAYEWGEPAWAKWLARRKGAVRMARLLMARRHRGITDQKVSDIFEASPEAFGQALAEALRPPNPPGPAGTPASPA
jgi:hypothetical protein